MTERSPLPKPRNLGAAHQAWNVYLHGKRIDTVFYTPICDRDEVYRSLVQHDGYDPGITVRRCNRY